VKSLRYECRDYLSDTRNTPRNKRTSARDWVVSMYEYKHLRDEGVSFHGRGSNRPSTAVRCTG